MHEAMWNERGGGEIGYVSFAAGVLLWAITKRACRAKAMSWEAELQAITGLAQHERPEGRAAFNAGHHT